MSIKNELKLFIKAKKNKRSVLKKSIIYKALGLPASGRDRLFSIVCFACDSCRECVAVISDYTFDIDHVTSRENCIENADYAMSRGAALLISTFQIKDYPCLIVEKPIEAYCQIVSTIRTGYNIKAAGVTGSIGKTTTKAFILNVLSQKYNTHTNESNLNDIRYTGLSVQKLSKEKEFYLQEIMEGPPFGTASPISKMVRPDISVITVVGTAHLEAFKTQDRILESCLGIQDGMPEDGVLVMNGDDPFQVSAKTRRKTVYYGIDNENVDFRAVNIKTDGGKILFDIVHEGITTPAVINCFGKHNVLDALAAFAVGKLAKVPEQDIINGLKQYHPEGMRQNLVSYGGYNVFLDCYNSSIESVKTSLEAFFSIEQSADGKRIAVIGDILEAGEKEEEVHRELGRILADTDMDILLFYGKSTAFSAEEAGKVTDKKVYHIENRSELIKMITEVISRGDLLFVKGSRGTNLEYAIDRLFGTSFYEESGGYSYVPEEHMSEEFTYMLYKEHAVLTGVRILNPELAIPTSVKERSVIGIEKGAFSNNNTVSVQLPDTLESIRDGSFSGAIKLERIDLPGNIRLIGNGAFENCTALTEVTVNNGCLHIGDRAFANCAELQKIRIPDTVGFIGKDAFKNCTGITISCNTGSFAEEYAKNNGIRFVTEQ